MACRYIMGNKSYSEEEFKNHLMDMPPAEAAKHMHGIKAVPDAPYKNSGWWELGMRRALREAAEKGYDKLSWTTGATQNERYNLSNHVDQLIYRPEYQELVGYKDGHAVVTQYKSPEELPELIGQDTTNKLLSTKPDEGGMHVLNGDDLKFGGNGMTGFYDDMIPKYMNKYLKRYGAKAEKDNVVVAPRRTYAVNSGKGGYRVVETTPGAEKNKPLAVFPSWGEAWARSQDLERQGYDKPATAPVWSVKMTPEMRKAFLTQGQPLFNLAPIGAGLAASGGAIDKYMNQVQQNDDRAAN
jgi:hypothetical protein